MLEQRVGEPLVSMAGRGTFTGFDSYKLIGVRVTDRELGHGSYATVLEVEYMGLKCAGKKIHDILVRQGDANYTVRRFEEECHLLSQIRHPNIVQFLGVHFHQGVTAPILVMELLPANLSSCIEQYGILPKEISYSILHDVALGLCYLHNQTPQVIHRDLSSNNVLLTPNMTAKISDLGVARILNLTPLQVSHMTQTPGTPAYMPPEVMIANPKYNTSIDEFSYGILMIHMFSGRWPEPQVGQTRFEADKLIPVTEAERREVFLQSIGSDHPLIDLILKCINNDPISRAHISEIVEQVAAMTLQFPASFTNRIEMLRWIEYGEKEIRALEDVRNTENQRREQEILTLRRGAQEKAEEICQLRMVHSSEVDQLKLQIRDLNSQYQLLVAKNETDVKKLKTKISVYKSDIEDQEKALQHEREEFQFHQSREREQFETELARKTEQVKMLTSELLQSRLSGNSLKHKNLTLEAKILRNAATIAANESELENKTKALEEKDAVVSGLSEQLTRAREFMSSKEHVSSAQLKQAHLRLQLAP